MARPSRAATVAASGFVLHAAGRHRRQDHRSGGRVRRTGRRQRAGAVRENRRAASSRSRPRPTTSAIGFTKSSTAPSSRPSTARTSPLLTSALDNVIDGMEHAAAFAALYRFDVLTEPMRQHGAHHQPRRPPNSSRPSAICASSPTPTSIREPDRRGPHARERGRHRLPRGDRRPLFTATSPAKELVRQKDMLFCAGRPASISARTRWTSSARWW